MEELYSIIRDFLEVEYNQESLLCLLKTAEAACTGEDQTEAKLIVNSVTFYVRGLQEELKAAIHRMDLYITENAKKQ